MKLLDKVIIFEELEKVIDLYKDSEHPINEVLSTLKNNRCVCGHFKSQHPIKKEFHGECIFKSCSCKKFKCEACNSIGYHESYNQICLCDCVGLKDD